MISIHKNKEQLMLIVMDAVTDVPKTLMGLGPFGYDFYINQISYKSVVINNMTTHSTNLHAKYQIQISYSKTILGIFVTCNFCSCHEAHDNMINTRHDLITKVHPPHNV